jgi:hypothetical protein
VHERELGQNIPVRTVPLGQTIPGMPQFLTELLAGLETYDSPIDSESLGAQYGIKPTPLADFVRSVVSERPQPVH